MKSGIVNDRSLENLLLTFYKNIRSIVSFKIFSVNFVMLFVSIVPFNILLLTFTVGRIREATDVGV